MKVIIAGSRGIYSFATVGDAMLAVAWPVTEVVSGTARGVDQLGERWARVHCIPVKRFPADWDRDGKAAGMIRNRRMASYADGLVAVWDGCSRGTEQMILEARKRGLRVYVHRV